MYMLLSQRRALSNLSEFLFERQVLFFNINSTETNQRGIPNKARNVNILNVYS